MHFDGPRSAYLLSSGASITCFVFVNGATPFLLQYLVDAPDNAGAIAGSMVLVDEMLALPLVLVWGYLIDRVSLRAVATSGHTIAAVGLLLMPQARSAYPGLLLTRIVISFGHSALTTTLSAGIALLAGPPPQSKNALDNEEQPLLATTQVKPEDSARLSGYVGLACGCGALLAVFVFLRLPPSLSSDQTSGGLRIGLQRAFYLVAILELSAALLCFWKLRPDQGPSEARASLAKECRRVLLGFRLVFTDGELAVASFSGMTARAATIVASLFIPLYIAQYFARSGRCDVDPSTPATKEGCREAYILSSSLTGTLQLASLLFAVIIGTLGSRRHSKAWQPGLLAMTYAIGAIAWLVWAFLPGQDPSRYAFSVPSAVILGMSQIAGVVLSLSMVARARTRLVAEQERSQDISGAIAGAYSALGSIAILIISQLGGILTDRHPGAAFLLMACLYLVLAIAAGLFSRQASRIMIE